MEVLFLNFKRMFLEEDTARIIESEEFEAPDFKGDNITWVKFIYYHEDPISVPVGVTVTEESYSKTLPDGRQQTIFYQAKKFHQIGDDWHEVEWATITKDEYVTLTE